MMNKFSYLFSLIIASLLGGILTLVGYKSFFESPSVQLPNEKQDIQLTNFNKKLLDNFTVPEGLNFVLAADKVTPAVVHIRTYYKHADYDWFRERSDGDFSRFASGSGVIISEDGYILTNHHVIDESDKFDVILNDKRSYQGTIIGTDPTTDLALIKIQAKNLPTIEFGNSDNLKIGEWVLAVGNPFDLTSTVTAGIISAKARNINILRSRDGLQIESFIQTDAAVNPGNSGGALVNLKGELIGINTAIATKTGGYAGYSFAVPVTLAKKVAEDLLRYGEVQRGLLGVNIRDIDASLANQYGIKNIKGVFVVNVNPKSAADEAGMEIGDIITKVEDVEVNTVAALQEIVARHRPGERIAVVFERGGVEKKVYLTLKNKNNEAVVTKLTENFEELGAEVAEVNQSDKKKHDIEGGVKIVKLKEGKLKKSKVMEGFIITHIDKLKIQTLADLKSALRTRKDKIIVEGIEPNGDKAFYGIGF
ncbi:trypsin-like peptidase domain-containing protein [Thermoflexibacter ruber]|nr:trypsin-like peptidase domain-containing protein [Thermoflexibacter ruber]